MTKHENACPLLAGVAFGETEQQVLHTLGRHHARYMLDGADKTLRYDDFGVEYVLTKERVYMLTMLGTRPALYEAVVDYVLNIPRQLIPN